MSVIKLLNRSLTPGDSAVAIDIPQDGTIEAVSLGIGIIGGTAVLDVGDGASAEVSFASQAGFETHDTRNSLCTVGAWVSELASAFHDGGGHNNPFCSITPINVPVNAGERVWLHVTHVGAGLYVAIAYLFVKDGAVNRTRIRNR